jgi:hypothetical protein
VALVNKANATLALGAALNLAELAADGGFPIAANTVLSVLDIFSGTYLPGGVPAGGSVLIPGAVEPHGVKFLRLAVEAGGGEAGVMVKQGAYAMQTAETSPVSWHDGRTLLVEEVTGNTPGVYDTCCTCATFGCVSDPNAPIGYADCTACESTCDDSFKAEYGTCAPPHVRIRDLQTLEVLVPVVPGSLGYAFASAFVDTGRLWVYGTDNRPTSGSSSGDVNVSCWSTDDPTNPNATWTASVAALTMPPELHARGFSIFNTDVARVAEEDANAPDRRFVMAIEVNAWGPWSTVFAESNNTTPDKGWAVLDPDTTHVNAGGVTNACPSVRFFDAYYYVVTTTQGDACPSAGWDNISSALCVIVYRSKDLQGPWLPGNAGTPIVFPSDDDRRVMPQWNATDAERAAIFGHAPQEDGDINNSDFDFCDSEGGVFAVYAGIANQKSNPYFYEGAFAPNVTSAEWLAGFFADESI